VLDACTVTVNDVEYAKLFDGVNVAVRVAALYATAPLTVLPSEVDRTVNTSVAGSMALENVTRGLDAGATLDAFGSGALLVTMGGDESSTLNSTSTQ
jgi:hypothetical protein